MQISLSACCEHRERYHCYTSSSCVMCEGGSNEWGMKLRFSKLFNFKITTERETPKFLYTTNNFIYCFLIFKNY